MLAFNHKIQLFLPIKSHTKSCAVRKCGLAKRTLTTVLFTYMWPMWVNLSICKHCLFQRCTMTLAHSHNLSKSVFMSIYRLACVQSYNLHNCIIFCFVTAKDCKTDKSKHVCSTTLPGNVMASYLSAASLNHVGRLFRFCMCAKWIDTRENEIYSYIYQWQKDLISEFPDIKKRHFSQS